MAQSGTSAEVDADIGNVRRRIDRLLDGSLRPGHSLASRSSRLPEITIGECSRRRSCFP